MAQRRIGCGQIVSAQDARVGQGRQNRGDRSRQREDELVENGPANRSETPGRAASWPASAAARAWLDSAARASPSAPSRAMWMVEAVTIRPWLVQMFEVALARRMCCSRGCSVSV